MQRQHSSEATSTLGNTPNLNIGSYDGKHYIGSQTKALLHKDVWLVGRVGFTTLFWNFIRNWKVAFEARPQLKIE